MTDRPAFQFTSADVSLAYDHLLVPRLFEPWAELLLDLAAPRRGEWLLDVATGPGTVARAAAARLGAEGRVVGTDVSPQMLGLARAKPAPPDAAAIEYIESPAAPLAVPDGAFDRVTCQQGLQFFPDRAAALLEMRRALRPGGVLAVAVWAAIEQCPIYAALHAALRATVPAALADELLAPWSLGDAAALGASVRDAGFRAPEIDTRSLPLVFELGVDQAAGALAATPLHPRLSSLPLERRAALTEAVRARLSALRDGDGAVRAPMTCHIALARRG